MSPGQRDTRSESKVGLGVGLPIGEAVRRRAGDQSERSGRRGGSESEAGAVPPRLGLPVGDWIALLDCRLGFWARPRVARRSQRRLLGRAFAEEQAY